MVFRKFEKLKIDVLLIGSEYDLNFFSRYKTQIKKKTNCEVCVANLKILKISNDKYLTQEFLKNNKLPYLKTFVPKKFKRSTYLLKKFQFKNYYEAKTRNIF